MLPKFLIADNSQQNPDKLYIIHNESPRFIVGFDIEDFNLNQEIYWFEEEPNEDEVNNLLEQSEKFLNDELESQEELFDEEEM